MLSLCGCQSKKSNITYGPPYPPSNPVSVVSDDRVLPVLSLDFIDCPLVTCLDYLSRKTGVSVYCVDDRRNTLVTLSCTDCSLLDLLSLLARSVSCELLPVGSGYFIGPATENDRVVVTARLSGYDVDDLKNVLLNVLPGCSVSVAPDGLCVVGCPVGSQSRVRSALESLQVSRGLYRVRLVYVSDWFDMDLVNGSFIVSGARVSKLSDWFWRDLLVGDFSISVGGQILNTSIEAVNDYVVSDGGKFKVR